MLFRSRNLFVVRSINCIKEYAERNTTVSGIWASLLELLDKTNSDAFILLNEGRQILGLILLGKKASGNVYSEYDYTTFNKFYSNLFVIGYYVKNIMNEAVVGTVNREIRMSGQIITSIQENMDLIKNMSCVGKADHIYEFTTNVMRRNHYVTNINFWIFDKIHVFLD